ncbi:carboxylesterase/lipase family protein [Nocardia higoensis]|uniref:carboxylesterase/lipase family protein n=1 Tax=Nocardia higoensis TaxID=228599 RepID=UPI000684B650|nr:carboxylesterase family protein [Nocardia higoensis]
MTKALPTESLAQAVTAHGPVRGLRDGDIEVYLGVPYAAPPVGPRRLRPPERPEPWQHVRDATRPGPTAARAPYVPAYEGVVPELLAPGDDHLHVNIWTPGRGQARPVLFWIHGGAFTNGSNALPLYDGAAFARDGVVVVSVNYRLGAEGWVHFDGNDSEASNLGLRDVLAALAWVRDNIAAFGGDPARVTVAGQSAGAMLATTLLAVPAARGLFHRLIAHSGAAANTITPDQARVVRTQLAARAGVEPTVAGFASVAPERLAQHARDLLHEVQTAADPAIWGGLALSTLPFAPVVDGSVVSTDPRSAVASGAAADIAILAGSNVEDARLILAASGAIDLIDEATLLAASTSYGLDAAAVETYRSARPRASSGDLLAAVVTDWFFRIPAIRLAETQAATGGQAWAFRFDWRSPALGGKLGSAHAVDLPFVFATHRHPGSHLLTGPDAPDAVARTTHEMYRAFVVEGDPGWTRYDTTTRTTGLLARERTVVEDPDSAERLLWKGLR